jgi:hypothetical protein
MLTTTRIQITHEFCSSFQLKQIIVTPTHKNRLIDHILVPLSSKVDSCGVAAPIEKWHSQTWANIEFTVPLSTQIPHHTTLQSRKLESAKSSSHAKKYPRQSSRCLYGG